MKEREIALYALTDVTKEKAYNNLVLKKTFETNDQLSLVEKAFITELVNGTLRNLIYIDYVINKFSNTETKKMKPLILNILRTAVYQIMFMDKVPDSAACNEAVLLTKKKKFQNLSGFVNGVLRNIVRNKDKIELPDEKKYPVEYLSLKYSFQEWIIRYWLSELSFEEVKEICINSTTTPKVSACINTIKCSKDELKKVLAKDNIVFSDAKFAKDVIYLTKTNDITKTSAFKQGLFHVMDESSLLSVLALNPKEGDTVIDVCAAPGGKSFYSAYLMNNKGRIFSRDVHEHKIELLEGTVKRLGIDIITSQLKDASVYYSEDSQKADCVIIDAPCSGFGLLRKKPDIKYNKTAEDIEALCEIQKKILESCHDYVKIGGTLVYSTCTISKKENLDNINWFCEKYNFELDDLTDLIEKNDIKFKTAEKGYIQILPHDYGTDGFFIARLVRKG